MLEASLNLAHVPGVSQREKKMLIDHFGSAQAVLTASQKTSGHDPAFETMLELIRQRLDPSFAHKEIKKLESLKAWAVPYESNAYPERLKYISDPPVVLFGQGQALQFLRHPLGFVGPRSPSGYGLRVAKLLAQDLVKEGLTLVSGLALGIDAVAHEAGVRLGKPTVAVVGTGLNETYPKEHQSLKEHILSTGGTVVTEYVCGTPPKKEHFPRRNRLISGLSQGVLVVEAGEKSGARITAKCALDQGREVYAVPGPIDSPHAFTTNVLISQGAKMVMSSKDILEDFFTFVSPKESKGDLELNADQKSIFEVLSEPLSAEEISFYTKKSISLTLKLLSEMENIGAVEHQKDQRYARVWRGTTP